MNRNKRSVKACAVLAAGLIASAGSVGVNAAPVAGVTGYTSTDKTTAEENTYSTRAGVSSMLTGIVTNSAITAKANEQAEVEAAEKKAAEDAAAAAAEAAKYANIGIAANLGDGFVYVRSAADQNSDYVGKLFNNAAVTITGEQGDWYSVTSGNVSGYVNKAYLVVGDKATVEAAATKIATVTTTTLYVREAPSTDSKVTGMVPGTDDLVVTDDSTKDQGWIKVDNGGEPGFVSTDFVTISSQYTYAESRAEEEAKIKAAEEAAAAEAAKQKAARQKSTNSSKTSSSKTSSRSQSRSTASYSAPSGGSGAAVASYACQFAGNPYVYGGTSLTNGADCSGFVQSVYAAFGVSLPHSSAGDRSVGYGVSQSEMQPGDIVCYSGHVGIYAGNGMLINAANEKTGITYTNANYSNILAVRRIF
jgi:cell wall-associated NlpC family hydrolase